MVRERHVSEDSGVFPEKLEEAASPRGSSRDERAPVSNNIDELKEEGGICLRQLWLKPVGSISSECQHAVIGKRGNTLCWGNSVGGGLTYLGVLCLTVVGSGEEKEKEEEEEKKVKGFVSPSNNTSTVVAQ